MAFKLERGGGIRFNGLAYCVHNPQRFSQAFSYCSHLKNPCEERSHSEHMNDGKPGIYERFSDHHNNEKKVTFYGPLEEFFVVYMTANLVFTRDCTNQSQ